jgi:hypothetical protein
MSVWCFGDRVLDSLRMIRLIKNTGITCVTPMAMSAAMLRGGDAGTLPSAVKASLQSGPLALGNRMAVLIVISRSTISPAYYKQRAWENERC